MEHKTTIISMATQKGGSGKTMLTHILGLAFTGKKEQKKVLLIDADVQGSLMVYDSYAKNAHNGDGHQSPFTLISSKLDTLFDLVKENYEKYDYIFIDIPGSLHAEGVRAALYLCDFVFIPVLPDISDFHAAQTTMDYLNEIKAAKQKDGGELKYFCFLNQAEPNRISTKNLLAAWEAYKIPRVPKPLPRYEKYKNIKTDTINILDREIESWGPEEYGLNAFFDEIKNIINNN